MFKTYNNYGQSKCIKKVHICGWFDELTGLMDVFNFFVTTADGRQLYCGYLHG